MLSYICQLNSAIAILCKLNLNRKSYKRLFAKLLPIFRLKFESDFLWNVIANLCFPCNNVKCLQNYASDFSIPSTSYPDKGALELRYTKATSERYVVCTSYSRYFLLTYLKSKFCHKYGYWAWKDSSIIFMRSKIV